MDVDASEAQNSPTLPAVFSPEGIETVSPAYINSETPPAAWVEAHPSRGKLRGPQTGSYQDY